MIRSVGGSAGIDQTARDAASAAQTTANAALPKTGGTMSGAIAMGGSKVTGAGAASASGELVRYEQLRPPTISPSWSSVALSSGVTRGTDNNGMAFDYRAINHTNITSVTANGDGVSVLFSGASATFNISGATMNGPRMVMVPPAIGPLRPSVQYSCRMVCSDIANFSTGTMHGGVFLQLRDHGASTAAENWIAIWLTHGAAGDVKIFSELTTNDSTSTLATVEIDSNTYWTTGTDLRIVITPGGVASLEYRLTGAGSWTVLTTQSLGACIVSAWGGAIDTASAVGTSAYTVVIDDLMFTPI